MVIKIETFLSVLITIVVIGLQTNGFKSPTDCGESSLIGGIKNFIVGGLDAEVSEFPFMVSLQNKKKDKHFCGGTVLNKRWVLTAAHCIAVSKMLGVFDSPEDIQMVIGKIDNTDTSEAYEVEKWIINGCFMKLSDKLKGDITLLKSKTDIKIDNINISSICLPPQGSDPIGTDIMVAGWGVWTETNILGAEKLPTILQKATTSVRSEEYCLIYSNFRTIGVYGWPLGERICLQKDGSTICRGDSGGPAFQIVGGRVYQYGIASFISAAIPDNTCGKSNPVLYVKLSKYIDWISDTIERYGDSSDVTIDTKCNQN